MADDLVTALRSRPVVAVELRPPRRELSAAAGMDAWIDTYHAITRLARGGRYVFVTDNAVGTSEEDNLRHLVTNMGEDVAPSRVVPFLTAKHDLAYCLAHADRAMLHGFRTLVVLGGDRSVGPARCVPHAYLLREAIRGRQPALGLGGWTNPHGDVARQVDYLLDERFAAEFYLTQVVSHHDAGTVERFLDTTRRRGVRLPGLFGVFYYRSANPATLAALSAFMPVPAAALTREFDAGLEATDVCARTIQTLADLGVRHFYISNLPLARAEATLSAILDRVKLAA